jgi:CRP-like cAMP-binding protein
MGAAASIEITNAKSAAADILKDKPMDASDIVDLEVAKAEIVKLRGLAKQLGAYESEAKVGGKVKREAVMDRGGAAKAQIDTATYQPKVVPKSQEIKDLLFNIVTKHNLFKSYVSEDHAAIVDAFSPEEVTAGASVIKQGEDGENFYVVEQGSLDIFLGDNKVGAPYTQGTSFGELALMYNTPRAATIKANTDCKLWVIDRSTYRGILVYNKFLRNKQYLELLKNVKIGEKELDKIMSVAELEQMAVALDKATYENSEKILIQGNTGDEFFIIADGKVKVLVADKDGTEKQVATLSKGDYFGEKALLSADVRGATCVAEGTVTCLTLERDDFLAMFGSFEELSNKDRSVTEAATSVPLEESATATSQLEITLN